MLIIRSQKTVFTVIILGLNTAEFANLCLYVNSAACARWLHETLHQISSNQVLTTSKTEIFFPRVNIKVSIDEMQRKGTFHIGRIRKPLSQH